MSDVCTIPTHSSNPYVDVMLKEHRIRSMQRLYDQVCRYRVFGTTISSVLLDQTWAADITIESTIGYSDSMTTYLHEYNLGRCGRRSKFH